MSYETGWRWGDAASRWLCTLSSEARRVEPTVTRELKNLVSRLVLAKAALEARENFGLISTLGDALDTGNLLLLEKFSDQTVAHSYAEGYTRARTRKMETNVIYT